MKTHFMGTIFSAAMAMLAFAATNQTATAAPTTKIIFPKGSYCASYSGNFSKSKTYSLYLLKNQDFEVKAANMEDGITIRDGRGLVRGQWIDDNTYRIHTRMKGNHFVTIHSPYGDQKVEFCAYSN